MLLYRLYENTSLVVGDVLIVTVKMAVSKVNFGLPYFCFFKIESKERTHTKVKYERRTVIYE